MEIVDLERAVEDSFERVADGLHRWDDPHPPPDRIVRDEEYERLTDPAKYLIIGARVDAWIDACVQRGLVDVVVDADVDWIESHAPDFVARFDRVVPVVEGAIDLVVARTRLDGVDGAGVWLGVARPGERRAASFEIVPDCGCDACDSGSDDLIVVIDDGIRPIVRGAFRHLRRAGRGGRLQTITIGDGGRRGSRNLGLRAADRVLVDPSGWEEWSDRPWLTDHPAGT